MRENIEEKYLIHSEEELVSIFLKESVGIYTKQKSNEHTGDFTNKAIRGYVKEDLGNLLDGLREYAKDIPKEQVDLLVSTLKTNLDSYVEKMDKELTKGRDEVLRKEKLTPNALRLDNAMTEAAQNSNFIKIAEHLKEHSAKDTGWKQLADFFRKVGCNTLSDSFEKKNEKSKLIALAKSTTKGLKNFDVRAEPLSSKNEAITGRHSSPTKASHER